MSSLFHDVVLRDLVVTQTSTRNADGVSKATTETAARSFGALLKHYRLQVGLSQETLAQNSCLSTETISALERGSRRNPYRETVALLAQALRLLPAERTLFELAARRHKITRGPTLPRRSCCFPGVAPAQITANLTSLTGASMVGKTPFALQIAGAFSPNVADGEYFIDLARLAESRLIASTISDPSGSALSVSAHPSAALHGLLAGKQLLLTLDNCEQLRAAVGAIAKFLLSQCPVASAARHPRAST